MMNHPTVVDLFCGCGGFGLGAELAGFKTLAAVDIDPVLQSAYSSNFPNTTTINKDASLLTQNDWDKVLDGQQVDGVIGGPPCQGFSRIGKRAEDDPRNTLLGTFYDQVKLLQPKFFVMENVEGLLDEKGVDLLMSALQTVSDDYTILDPLVIKASDYGAPTIRTRVMVIGYKNDQMDPLNLKMFAPPKDQVAVTVGDAIRDLPRPIMTARSKEEMSWAKYPKVPLEDLSAYARRMRTMPPVGLGATESNKQIERGFSSGHEATVHTDPVAERYGALKLGEVDRVSKATRLDWNGLCPTLRAGTGKDKGSHQAVRPIHPVQPRVITVREAARLQGFPDWFTFHNTKWSSFRMIGNSVSPVVSQFVLSMIHARLGLKLAA